MVFVDYFCGLLQNQDLLRSVSRFKDPIFFIPLPSSGDCSPVSGQTTWLMFATPVRGLELSEIWGLFIQICEILLQQWNCVFSLLDVPVSLFSRLIFESQALYFKSANFSVSCLKIPILHLEQNTGPFVSQSNVLPLCQPALAKDPIINS